MASLVLSDMLWGLKLSDFIGSAVRWDEYGYDGVSDSYRQAAAASAIDEDAAMWERAVGAAVGFTTGLLVYWMFEDKAEAEAEEAQAEARRRAAAEARRAEAEARRRAAAEEVEARRAEAEARRRAAAEAEAGGSAEGNR